MNPLFQTGYLAALLSSIDDAVVATDENFIIRYWNRKAEQLFGITAQEAVGKRGADILQFIYREQTREEAREILLRKGSWKGRLNYQNQNGSKLLLDASVTAVRNKDGKTIGFVGVHRDITDYNWAKTSLHTFLSLVSSSNDYFFVVDRHLNIAFIDDYTNQRLTDIYGFNYRVGENVIHKLPPNRQEQIRTCFQTALAGGKSVYEINITTHKGKKLWLQVSYFPVMDNYGTITHACSMVRNITAQKEVDRVNQELYKSRQLFETFMENSPILSWITDINGIIKYMNPSYLQTFNLTKEAFGKSLSMIFPEATATMFMENNRKVHETEQPVNFSEKAILPDGQEKIYQVIKFPVAFEEAIYIGGWAIDMTEEKALRRTLSESLVRLKTSESNLKQALEKEHQLNDLKSRFVSMASHEFRTPLSTMLSSIYLLEKYTTTEQQMARLKHAAKIKEAIQHMNGLLEDFLSIGKLEEGAIFIQPTSIDVNELLRDTIEEMQPFKKTGQEITLEPNEGLTLITDKKMLKNIVTNLLSNALKFSGDHTKVEAKLSASNGAVSLTVRDEGIGISEEDQRHLFQSFFRGKNAKNIQGTGLGLHIVKRYIELLKGELELQSTLGVGTTITVKIPQFAKT